MFQPIGSQAISALARLVELSDHGHYYCEDSWCACPKHSEYSGPEDETECNCGYDKQLAALRDVAAALGIEANTQPGGGS